MQGPQVKTKEKILPVENHTGKKKGGRKQAKAGLQPLWDKKTYIKKNSLSSWAGDSERGKNPPFGLPKTKHYPLLRGKNRQAYKDMGSVAVHDEGKDVAMSFPFVRAKRRKRKRSEKRTKIY